VEQSLFDSPETVAMTKRAERELHRLTQCLAEIEKRCGPSDRERQALRKAGIALCLIFMNKLDPRLKNEYAFLKNLDAEAEKANGKNRKFASGKLAGSLRVGRGNDNAAVRKAFKKKTFSSPHPPR
jgi:hypothetical protein